MTNPPNHWKDLVRNITSAQLQQSRDTHHRLSSNLIPRVMKMEQTDKDTNQRIDQLESAVNNLMTVIQKMKQTNATTSKHVKKTPSATPAASGKSKLSAIISKHYTSIMYLLKQWMLLLFFIPLLHTVIAQEPMVCQSHGGTIWEIDTPKPCIFNNTNRSYENPKPATLYFYKYNEVEYRSIAFHCIKIKQSLTKFMWFFGDEMRQWETTEHMPMTEAKCRQMSLHHTCNEGPMIDIAGLIQMTNKLDTSNPSAGFSCCKNVTKTATNCFLYQAPIYKRHNAEMTSPIGEVSHCQYKKRSCILNDNSVIIWKPLSEPECAYIPWRSFSGQIYDGHFMADNHQLAITWNSHSKALSRL